MLLPKFWKFSLVTNWFFKFSSTCVYLISYWYARAKIFVYKKFLCTKNFWIQKFVCTVIPFLQLVNFCTKIFCMKIFVQLEFLKKFHKLCLFRERKYFYNKITELRYEHQYYLKNFNLLLHQH